MTEITWPATLSPRVVSLQLINQTRSQQESMSGLQQVLPSIAQRWRVSYDFPVLRRQAVLDYRSFLAAMEGRANTVRLPVWDKKLEPLWHPRSGANVSSETRTLNGVASGTRQGAVITVDQTPIRGAIRPGHYVGVDGYTYMVTGISGNQMTVQPRLRTTFANAGITTRPTMLCRLGGDEIGELALDLGLRGSPSLEFVEIIP